jgi:uncharacterized protein
VDVIFLGGLARGLQGLASAAPTLLVGLWVAAIMRYYLKTEGVLRLFGGTSLRSLPQSWLIGMLLPVCSIGVLPIIREMKRLGVRPGAITAFALSAPLFNPLSLLYGLTLSRPIVICGFALGSLLIVTVLGLIWDRVAQRKDSVETPRDPLFGTNSPDGTTRDDNKVDENIVDDGPIGVRRLLASLVFMGQEFFGVTGVLYFVAVLGLVFLGGMLPHGALQTSVEPYDLWAPLTMSVVAVPIYATPMLTMSQLGMMFAHANSPGAAFCLLLLGTGMNLATLVWFVKNYTAKATFLWFGTLMVLVLACGYAVNRPLIPVGVQPAGHTHAFDIYTNPFHQNVPVTAHAFQEKVKENLGLADIVGLIALVIVASAGRFLGIWFNDSSRPARSKLQNQDLGRFDRAVSPQLVGVVGLVGLIAVSVVSCYAYYPDPAESLEEMRLARAETLSGANTGEVKHALHWLEVWDDWSRKLEVGAMIRRFEVRPYQRMQGYLLRKKLEMLEHELEHDPLEPDEIRLLCNQLSNTSRRISAAYQRNQAAAVSK